MRLDRATRVSGMWQERGTVPDIEPMIRAEGNCVRSAPNQGAGMAILGQTWRTGIGDYA